MIIFNEIKKNLKFITLVFFRFLKRIRKFFITQKKDEKHSTCCKVKTKWRSLSKNSNIKQKKNRAEGKVLVKNIIERIFIKKIKKLNFLSGEGFVKIKKCDEGRKK